MGVWAVSRVTTRFILIIALVVQMTGICTLLITDFSSPTSDIAFWAVIGAGIVEVVLTLHAKCQNDALTG
jgi:hypothetical protein